VEQEPGRKNARQNNCKVLLGSHVLQESVNNLLLSKIGEESESNIKKIEAVVRTLVSDDVPIDNIFSTDLITQDGIEPTIKTLHVESIEAKLRR
jgi:hypothetical protein